MKKDKHIALIGMPGSGKTTIGKLLAQRLSLPYIDTDQYIQQTTGKSIKELFIKGESYFREIESKAIEEVSKEASRVISTGGGVVKTPENMETLRKNAIIIFLHRPVDHIVADIDVCSRPLLAKDASKIYELYKERYPLYKKYSDYEIYNDKSLGEVVEKIVKYIRLSVPN